MSQDMHRVSVTLIGRRLVVSVNGDFAALDLAGLESTLLKRIESAEIDVVAFDISTVSVTDLDEIRSFISLLRVVDLMGGQPVVLGMQPGVAAFLAESDLDLGAWCTALSFDDIDDRLSAGR